MLLKRLHIRLSGHLPLPQKLTASSSRSPYPSELREATQRSTTVQKPLCEKPPEREDGSGGKPEGFPDLPLIFFRSLREHRPLRNGLH